MSEGTGDKEKAQEAEGGSVKTEDEVAIEDTEVHERGSVEEGRYIYSNNEHAMQCMLCQDFQNES